MYAINSSMCTSLKCRFETVLELGVLEPEKF
jgi:hypothetical protein